MKPRKRAFEDTDSDPLPAKNRWLQPALSLPTPSLTASPIHDQLSQGRKARKQSSRASLPSEPKPLKRAVEDPDPNCAPTWFLDKWLQDIYPSTLAQERGENSGIIATIEGPHFPPILVSDLQAASDQMSQQEGETPAPSSMASTHTERLNTSSPLFRATLKMNGIVMDNLGTKIPREVQGLVDKHIRKERSSPRLGEDEKLRIIEQIGKIWDKAKLSVSDIIKTSLFPLDAPGIAEGRETPWSTKPLPRNSDYPYALPAPKTDCHFGFPLSQDSDWSDQELSVADHPKARPYTQPTRENLFPSFLVEIISEATNGTLYAAEGQAAVSGAHRVSSLIWLLDQVDPSRTRSSADALAFSAVVSQREAVAHVHYYNPEDKMFYMSYIDAFPFLKDPQGCRDHHKNVAEWLLQIQQPIVKEVLRTLYPLQKLWKKGRSASTIADGTESLASEEGRSSKSQRT